MRKKKMEKIGNSGNRIQSMLFQAGFSVFLNRKKNFCYMENTFKTEFSTSERKYLDSFKQMTLINFHWFINTIILLYFVMSFVN